MRKQENKGCPCQSGGPLFWAMDMDELTTLRTFAACTKVLRRHGRGEYECPHDRCGLCNLHRRFRMDGGRLVRKQIIPVIQNVILLLINILGVWRWLPRAEKEATGQKPTRHPSFVKD